MNRFLAALFLCTMCAIVQAQYPEKPIHLIVPYAAGAIADHPGRLAHRDVLLGALFPL